jgi:hypothetical protein
MGPFWIWRTLYLKLSEPVDSPLASSLSVEYTIPLTSLGVGSADVSKMDILDSNKALLKDIKGNATERDIV